jgi:DNA invertase Pin-like site-specific DNA recombinase
VGTHQDNMRDMAIHGRRAGRGGKKGADHHKARLDDDDVRAIRAAHAAGESQSSIARRLGMSQANISRIVLRQNWSHVA